MPTTVTTEEFKIQLQNTESTTKTWIYPSFTIAAYGEHKTATHCLLYTVAKKGKRESTPATRVERFAQRFAYMANREMLNPDPYFFASTDHTVEAVYSLAHQALSSACENARNGIYPDNDEIDDIARRCANITTRMGNELRKAAAHWDEHGFLSWDYADLPMWNVRGDFTRFFHKISVERLRRLHVAVSFIKVPNGSQHTVIEVIGRNQSQRKRIEAPLHLLETTFPKTVRHNDGIWTLFGEEGRDMAINWRENFYSNMGFRMIMRTPIA